MIHGPAGDRGRPHGPGHRGRALGPGAGGSENAVTNPFGHSGPARRELVGRHVRPSRDARIRALGRRVRDPRLDAACRCLPPARDLPIGPHRAQQAPLIRASSTSSPTTDPRRIRTEPARAATHWHGGRRRRLAAVTPTRAELVAAARAGDRVAFGRLVEPSLAPALGASILITRSHADGHDAVQDALLTAWLGLDQIRDPDAFPAWFRTLVIRSALRVARRRGHVGELDGRPGTRVGRRRPRAIGRPPPAPTRLRPACHPRIAGC